jgi:hypothetical protein
MHRVVFEPTIVAFERAKTVHAVDRATTVIGMFKCNSANINVFLPSLLFYIFYRQS